MEHRFFRALDYRRVIAGPRRLYVRPSHSAICPQSVTVPRRPAPLLIWLLYRLGYDKRAFLAQTVVAIVILPLSYFFSDPRQNINWVYGFGEKPQTRIPALWFLIFLILLFPLAVYLPTHLVLAKLFGSAIR